MFIIDKLNKKFEELSLIPLSGTDLNSDLILIKCYFNMWSEINAWLEKSHLTGKVGTEFKIFGIGRDGDYDFSLVALTLIAKKWSNNLSQKAKNNLINNILTQKGNNLLSEKWLFNLIPETENHLILSNSSLYLTNEILFDSSGDKKYNNLTNGVHIWLFNYLKNIIKNGLYEYNAKPYSSWTIRALQNLYSYSNNKEIKTISKILLDQLFFKFIIQSKNANLVVPFRRRSDHLVDEIRVNDEYATWFLALTGWIPDSEDMVVAKHDLIFVLTTMIQDYKPHNEFIQLAFNDKPIWSKCKHSNTEISYKEKNFALFSGGHEDRPYIIPTPEDGIVRETCLFLNDDSTKMSQLIRFNSINGFWQTKNNTGVYKNFACGANIIIPANFYIKKVLELNLAVYNFLETDNCYIVIKTLDNPINLTNTLKNVGCLEIVNKTEINSFEDFYNKVLELNQTTKLTLTGNSSYNSIRGYQISFKCITNNKDWLISKVEKNGIIIEEGGNASQTWQYLYVETTDGICIAHSNIGGFSYSNDGFHYSSSFSEDIPQILNYKMT